MQHKWIRIYLVISACFTLMNVCIVQGGCSVWNCPSVWQLRSIFCWWQWQHLRSWPDYMAFTFLKLLCKSAFNHYFLNMFIYWNKFTYVCRVCLLLKVWWSLLWTVPVSVHEASVFYWWEWSTFWPHDTSFWRWGNCWSFINHIHEENHLMYIN